MRHAGPHSSSGCRRARRADTSSGIETAEPVHRRHAIDRHDVRRDPVRDGVARGHGHDFAERAHENRLEPAVHGLLVPEVAAAILHPLEVAHHHAARVRQNVGDHENPFVLENLVGVRAGGAVGALADDLRLDVAGILAGDDVLGGGGNQHVAVDGEQLAVLNRLGLGIAGELPVLFRPLQHVLDVQDMLKWAKEHRQLAGYPKAETIQHGELLTVDCDVLVPAATENVITSKNARHIKAKIICEGANGPTSANADKILEDKGIFVIPDILANAGGVTVSYFEWVQDRGGYFWDEETVNRRLEAILVRSFGEVMAMASRYSVANRIASYIVAVDRVAAMHRLRGLYA